MKNKSGKHQYQGRRKKAKDRNFLFFTFYFCLLFTLSGCESLFSNAPGPDYYQIEYPFQPSSCDKPFAGTLRIWPFNAVAPFDREEMIATSPSLQVRFSSHYKWVNPAADMLAGNLMRDLSLGKVFESIVPAGNPMPAEYGMGGQIYRFALEESGASPHALLDLEVSLWQEKPRTVLFRKHFHYESPPLSSSGPNEFAGAMAGLVSQLSVDLRNDLCTFMQDSSRPAGG